MIGRKMYIENGEQLLQSGVKKFTIRTGDHAGSVGTVKTTEEGGVLLYVEHPKTSSTSSFPLRSFAELGFMIEILEMKGNNPSFHWIVFSNDHSWTTASQIVYQYYGTEDDVKKVLFDLILDDQYINENNNKNDPFVHGVMKQDYIARVRDSESNTYGFTAYNEYECHKVEYFAVKLNDIPSLQ